MRKDGPHEGLKVEGELPLPEELAFRDRLDAVQSETAGLLAAEDFTGAMQALASLRSVVDAFFEKVTVNAEMPELRRNRLRLLARFRDTVNQIADFSRVEG